MASRPHGLVAESADAADLKSDSPLSNPLHIKQVTADQIVTPAVGPAMGANSDCADLRLASVVAAWDGLPESLRAGIAAMVRAANTYKENDHGEG